jgi:N-formylglutamate deformylase
MIPLFTVHEGDSPLLISIPHAGTAAPDDIQARFTAHAAPLADTDWHVPVLYSFAAELGATVLTAAYSRYVIDLNRPLDGAPLYPGKIETALCPNYTFDGEPLYQADLEPTTNEIEMRIEQYWRPYHRELQLRLAALKEQFGYALLWDAHSIRSRIPRLFDGELPNLNLGTADGQSCTAALAQALFKQAAASPFSAVLNGRFKGGFITRHYGRPDEKIDAVQLELTQKLYANEQAPFELHPQDATYLSITLRKLIETLLAFRSSR